MKDTGSFAQLARLVPATDEEVRSRVEDTFTESNEKSNADDLVASRGSRKCECENRPDELTAWYPDGRANLCEDELGRQLTYDVASSPRNINQIELVGVHGQVFLHPRYICVGYVGLVKIFDKVAEAQDREEASVQLLDENPFLMSPRGLIILQQVISSRMHTSTIDTYPEIGPPRRRLCLIVTTGGFRVQACGLGIRRLEVMLTFRFLVHAVEK